MILDSMILEPKAVEWASAMLRHFRECTTARLKTLCGGLVRYGYGGEAPPP